MQTVHKYPLPIRDGWQELRLPVDARIVHVAEQPPGSGETLDRDDAGDLTARLWLWAEVNPDHDVEVRRLVVLGSGHPIPRSPAGKRPHYLATVVTVSGALVWHVYAEPTLT